MYEIIFWTKMLDQMWKMQPNYVKYMWEQSKRQRTNESLGEIPQKNICWHEKVDSE